MRRFSLARWMVLFVGFMFSMGVVSQEDDQTPFLFYQLEDGSFYIQQGAENNIRAGTLPAVFIEHRLSPDGQRLILTSGGVASITQLNGRNAIPLTENVNRAVWSPDSQYVALLKEDENLIQIYTVDGDLDQEISIPLNGRSEIDMDWGGTRIAIATDDGLYGVEVSTGETRTLFDGGRIGFVDWSPDGERLLFVRLSNTTVSGWLVDFHDRSVNLLTFDEAGTPMIETIAESGREPFSDMGMGDARWSPDGTQLAFIAFGIDMLISDFPGLSLVVMDATSFEVVARVGANNASALEGYYLYDFAWSPDGRFIAMNGFDDGLYGMIAVYTLETDELERQDLAIRYYSVPAWRNIPDDVMTALTEQVCSAMANSGANLREEPSNNGALGGSLAARELVQIDAQIERESFVWYHTVENLWVRGDVVSLEGDCDGLAVFR